MITFAILVVIVVLIIVFKPFFVVSQQTAYIIERLGRFNRIEGAGLHFYIPLLERIAAKVNLKTSQETFKIDAKTRDNVTVTMEIAAQYRVSMAPATSAEQSGVYRSFYMLNDPIVQMRSYLIDALRSSVPQFSLDEVFDKKDAIAADVNSTVSKLMFNYGYDVVSTLIISIDLPADVERSMNSINAAQRDKEAAQSLADAERIKVVTEAKAKAEAMEQAGIGIAKQRKAIADGITASLATIRESGVTESEANWLFAYTQWTDMMTEFAKSGRQGTVVLPSDFNQSASMFDQMMIAQKAAEQDQR